MKLILYLLIVILLAAYVNTLNNSRRLDIQYSYKPDSAGFYFLKGISDPGLFKDDLLTDNVRHGLGLSKGIYLAWAVYLALLSVLPLAVAIKIVSIMLCTLATALIYKTGMNLYDSRPRAILLAGLFLVFFLSTDIFVGGQLRAFGALLFCAFLYFLTKARYAILPLFCVCAFIIYPPLALTLVYSCILLAVYLKKKLLALRKYLYILGMSLALILFMYNFSLFALPIKRIVGGSLAFSQYKFTQAVPGPLDPRSPSDIILYFILNLNEYTPQYKYMCAIFIIFSALFLIFKRRAALRLPWQIWLILAASAAGFVSIYPLQPVSASRQLIFTLPLLLVFLVSFNLSDTLGRSARLELLLFPFMLLLLFFNPRYNALLDQRGYKPAYDYIERLPEGVMIAGFPAGVFTQSVPLFAKRQLFFMDETREPLIFFYPERELAARRQELISALYADSKKKVTDFIARHKIDYFLLESRYYGKEFADAPGAGRLLFDLAGEKADFKLRVGDNEVLLLAAEKIKE